MLFLTFLFLRGFLVRWPQIELKRDSREPKKASRELKAATNSANSTGQGMGGMHTVWTRYGKGMRPSLKSFAIKYGGMAYRGAGGHPQKTARIARARTLPSASPRNLGSASMRLKARECRMLTTEH